jgi:hypothetical protein
MGLMDEESLMCPRDKAAMIYDFASSELDSDDVKLKQEEDGLLKILESDELDEEDRMWDIYGQLDSTLLQKYFVSEYRI